MSLLSNAYIDESDDLSTDMLESLSGDNDFELSNTDTDLLSGDDNLPTKYQVSRPQIFQILCPTTITLPTKYQV